MFGSLNQKSQTQSNLFGGFTSLQQQPQQQQTQPSFQQPQQPQQPSIFNNSMFSSQAPPQPPPPPPQQQQHQNTSRFNKYQLNNTSEHQLFSNSASSLSIPNRNNVSPSSTDENNQENGGILSINTVKKRKIPNHLIKRIGKKNDNSTEEDKTSGPILPFKTTKQIQPDNFEHDFSHLFTDDRPPKNSMFDPQSFKDELTTGEMLMGESLFNKMNENPNLFQNIFQRPNRNLLNSETTKTNKDHNVDKSNIEYPWGESHNSISHELQKNNQSKLTTNSISNSHQQHSIQKLYCSVIVYGFDDAYFQLIVEHFAKYGKIMEDLLTSDYNYYYGALGNVVAHETLVDFTDNNRPNDTSMKNQNTFPLFLGPSWVKITYDNPNSAIRALADNLTDDGKGNVLGVLPYRREDLEILLNHPIPDDLDIGEGLHGLSHDLELEKRLADNEIGRYLNLARSEKNDITTASSTNRKTSSLTVKDGSKLLIQKKKSLDNKNIWHKSLGFLFGQGEI